jgi:hypothetical protein
MKFRAVQAPDANGNDFEAYVAHTRSGEPVYVDRALADLAQALHDKLGRGPTRAKLIAAEVDAVERSGA